MILFFIIIFFIIFINKFHKKIFFIYRSIRIGKILIAEDCRVLYARLMTDIARRRILLLYPIMTTGHTANKAVKLLLENGVKEKKICLITAFCTPQSILFFILI